MCVQQVHKCSLYGSSETARPAAEIDMRSTVFEGLGVSPDTMFYIAPYISTINGVLKILPDPNVGENGRHTVLVDNTSFKRIRNTIIQNLDKWIINHVSSNALPREEQFLGPPRVKPIHEDGMSSGENSWMS